VVKLPLNLHNAIFLFFAAPLAGESMPLPVAESFVAFPALLLPAFLLSQQCHKHSRPLGGHHGEQRRVSSKVKHPAPRMIPLVVTSILGGLAGAFLLIKTPRRLSCTFCRGSCLAPRYFLPAECAP